MTSFFNKRGVRMGLYLAGAAIVALGLFLLYVAAQPNDFRVARSQEMAASPADVFAHVNELRQWADWSPFEKIDPTMTKSFEGPPAGSGAKYSWAGDGRAGAGSITITDSRPSELILIKLEMLRPFACANDVTFTFRPAGDRTLVTWEMTGQVSLVPKIIHQFVSMDKMVGGEFERGLENLKTLVEQR